MTTHTYLHAAALLLACTAPAWAQGQQQGGMNHTPGMAMPGMTMPPAPGANATTPNAATNSTGRSSGAATAADATAANSVPAPGGASGEGSRQGNLSPEQLYASPVADQEKFSFFLFDQLEYSSRRGEGEFVYDILAWRGGDRRRTWLRADGEQSSRLREGGNASVELLRGKLISPYFDRLIGVRLDRSYGRGNDRGRVFGVLSLQGLSPYRYETEASLFIDQNGKVSARFEGTYDLLITQKLILQPRLEANAALQRAERFNVGSGLNDVELGLRLRYEIRREFAPYIGISYGRAFGGTASLLRRAGEEPNGLSYVAGVRAWF